MLSKCWCPFCARLVHESNSLMLEILDMAIVRNYEQKAKMGDYKRKLKNKIYGAGRILKSLNQIRK